MSCCFLIPGLNEGKTGGTSSCHLKWTLGNVSLISLILIPQNVLVTFLLLGETTRTKNNLQKNLFLAYSSRRLRVSGEAWHQAVGMAGKQKAECSHPHPKQEAERENEQKVSWDNKCSSPDPSNVLSSSRLHILIAFQS